MTRTLTVSGLGSLVELRLLDGTLGTGADKALWEHLEDVWHRARADAPGRGKPVVARLGMNSDGTDDIVAAQHPDRLSNAITQTVTRALITTRIGEFLMLHAGGVSHPATGASLVFAAPGGTGKTTLVSALGRRYGYLSDETIGIDASGHIHPYPKPLSRSQPAGGKLETSPDALHLLPAHLHPRLAKVVVLSRDPEARDLTIEPLSILEAIEALAPETSSLARLPRPLHFVADLLAATGGAERWTYAEHGDLLPRATEILGEP